VLHNVCLARLQLAFVFFFQSTIIRIRIRPNTEKLIFGTALITIIKQYQAN